LPLAAALARIPDSTRKVAFFVRGESERDFAMTRRAINVEFVLPTALAMVLGILLSIGAVYLADDHLSWLI
jgi:hypothetical protein